MKLQYDYIKIEQTDKWLQGEILYQPITQVSYKTKIPRADGLLISIFIAESPTAWGSKHALIN